MASCQRCGDTGIFTKPGSDTLVECQCALVRRLAASMPPHIRRANAVREHFELPLVRKPFRSAFVRSSWADMKAMVKAVVMTNPSSFVKVTSDREILDVYLGKKSRGSRDFETRRARNAAELEDSDASYNSIEDLMDLPKLCVVRLNEIGYKNKSAPGCLMEALEYRIDRDKPVWVVQDPNKPFVQGSPAWSESVWDYLTTAIPSTVIPRIAPSVTLELMDAQERPAFRPVDEPPAAAPSDPPPFDLEPAESPAARRPRQQRRVEQEREDAPAGLGLYGSGLGKAKGGRFQRGG